MDRLKYCVVIGVVTFFLLISTSLVTFAESAPENTPPGNDYPIILVHGLAGWGDGEMFGIHYWGGENDVPSFLNDNGHETYTATVGPISSNWDRAIELYYYIKGGTVDYGAAHAEEYGHERYGRTFPGIYPDWDGQSKVHLVGHSMGGQTIRVLTELLANGSEDEQQYHEKHPEEELAPVFQGEKDWVHSVTSIATPHNGSTFADEEDIVPMIKKMVVDFAALSGVNSRENIVYDFKVDQWGLKRKSGERFTTYMDRVLNSNVWDSEDVSVYDLTTKGAEELNHWVDTQPNVYYFSYTGNASYKMLSGRYYPMASMNPFMWGSSSHMGSYTRNIPEPVIDREWWPNDGLVNVISSQYPFDQPHHAFDEEEETSRGEWNHHSVKQSWDHLDFIGLSLAHAIGVREVNDFYLDMADELHGLSE